MHSYDEKTHILGKSVLMLRSAAPNKGLTVAPLMSHTSLNAVIVKNKET